MESFWLAMSEPPELPRSKIRSTRAVVSGRARSRATRRRKYSARDTPRSLARWRARRCISVSRVICVFAIIMAPSYCKSFPSSKVAAGLEALPAKTLLWALLLGQLLRECTFHGVESLVRISGCRALLVSSIFSDDTLGYFTERLDVGRCREALLRVCAEPSATRCSPTVASSVWRWMAAPAADAARPCRPVCAAAGKTPRRRC